MLKGNQKVNASVHDPAIFSPGKGNYYIFGTHMAAAQSSNLTDWDNFLTESETPENPLFDNLFDDFSKDNNPNESGSGPFDFCGYFNGKDPAVWAPEVSYNSYLKKYVMYFCTSGSYIRSSLCMATSDNVEGPYHFERRLLDSGFTAKDSAEKITDGWAVEGGTSHNIPAKYLRKNGSYNNLSWPNCIDPNTFHDEDGRFYMVYGSWSGGIFLLEIDEKTGLLIHLEKDDAKNHVDRYFGRRLIGGGHKSIEGPFVLYDKESGYYYLFVSFGWLGRDGGYQIREFRSKKPEGPYTDMNGKTFGRVSDHSRYGLKLIGNYDLPSLETAYKAPGHCSAFTDTDGKIYLVHHQRFEDGTERHEPRVRRLFRSSDGWLLPAPFAVSGDETKIANEADILNAMKIANAGENVNAEKTANAEENVNAEKTANAEENSAGIKNKISGEYYVVNHGTDISGEVHCAEKKEIRTEKISSEKISSTKIGSEKSSSEKNSSEKSSSGKSSSGKNSSGKNKSGKNSFEKICLDENEGIVPALQNGICIRQTDEAGNAVECIIAAKDNECIWAVKYL